MTSEQKCRSCGNIKEITEFPRRGNETDRFGSPVYRKTCKACEADAKLKKYHEKKEVKDKTADVYMPPPSIVKEVKEFAFAPKEPGKFSKNRDDYAPWEKLKGRELTAEEKFELESSMRELIVAMMEVVIKEKRS